ncbi:MAG: DUF6364 family protein [Thermodesulfobacteriota bacterium]
MKQNITLSLDKRLIQQAKILAAKRSTSVSGLLSDELIRIIQESESYERAKRAALADLENGFALGGKPVGREELHER